LGKPDFKAAGSKGKAPARLRVSCGFMHNRTAPTVIQNCRLPAPPHSRPPLHATAHAPPLSIVASSRQCSLRTLACRLPQPPVVVALLHGCSPLPSAFRTLTGTRVAVHRPLLSQDLMLPIFRDRFRKFEIRVAGLPNRRACGLPDGEFLVATALLCSSWNPQVTPNLDE
jgi:hypothetical protein